MKKVLIGLFVLASVSAFANDGVNVYGKVGVDTFSKFTAVKPDDNMKKTPTKGKVGVNFAVEVTKDVTPNFELGAGLAYTYRKDSKMNDTLKIEGRYFKIDLDVPRYESIPVYLTGKYNFDIDSVVRPYVKADLGYSFNRDINVKLTGTDIATKIKLVEDETKVKVKNGLYAAVGVGAEYNNFVADLSYVHTNAKLKDPENGETAKYNNGALRLSVGYKFSF